MDLVILKSYQMTRTTPELAPPSPNFRNTPATGRLTPGRFNLHQAHKYGGSSLESGSEGETLPLGHRGPTNLLRISAFISYFTNCIIT
ncbi:hypothetical protein AVEN_232051-1 [Araneus ventricosus]|uniref:Uncharacterized protein n=1 Tax=Araneus ventricosus TaxID=182803 RepID=A0A4Y2EJG6_ARAVE|nr:hypothetical protein AVEN_232051-1 [Araneus ventricosus]